MIDVSCPAAAHDGGRRGCNVTARMPQALGWLSSVILIATLANQVHKQWKSGSCEGISHWLFIGQTTASLGFTLYSWLVRDWVFVVTNGILVVNGSAGFLILRRNCHRRDRDAQAESTPARTSLA